MGLIKLDMFYTNQVPIGDVYVPIGTQCNEETGISHDVFYKFNTGEHWIKGLYLDPTRLPR